MENPEEFIRHYEQALEAQKWESVAPLIHENCVATFSEGTYIGKEEVASAFSKTFDLIKDESYKISNIHWAIKNENMAVLIFNFNWAGIIKGQKVAGGGRGTSTLVNTNGVWQLLAEHLGPNA